MAIGEIKETFFLSPRDAIDELVGPATHGDVWITRLPSDDDRVKVALRNLYKALQSGAVAAFHHDFDGHERKLTAVEAANDFFKIDLARNCCLFGPLVGPPRELKISRGDLAAYLQAAIKAQEPEILDDLDQCTRWLIERLRAPGRRPVNKELQPEAKTLWPNLSERGYRTARKNALSRMGKEPSAFSGRSPKEKPSHSD